MVPGGTGKKWERRNKSMQARWGRKNVGKRFAKKSPVRSSVAEWRTKRRHQVQRVQRDNFLIQNSETLGGGRLKLKRTQDRSMPRTSQDRAIWKKGCYGQKLSEQRNKVEICTKKAAPKEKHPKYCTQEKLEAANSRGIIKRRSKSA